MSVLTADDILCFSFHQNRFGGVSGAQYAGHFGDGEVKQ